jgi:hypothetical protein
MSGASIQGVDGMDQKYDPYGTVPGLSGAVAAAGLEVAAAR